MIFLPFFLTCVGPLFKISIIGIFWQILNFTVFEEELYGNIKGKQEL